LLRAGRGGDTHELGCAPEIGSGSGRRHFGDRLAAANQAAGIDSVVAVRLYRNRLAGQRRLVDEQRPRQDTRVGRNQSSQRQPDGIAGNELRGRKPVPGAVAADQRRRREPLPESGERRAGSALLDEAECCIEGQQPADHRGLKVLAEPDLENDRALEHPRDGRPELRKEGLPQGGRLVGDGIRTEAAEPPAGFGAREARRDRGNGGGPVDAGRRFFGHVDEFIQVRGWYAAYRTGRRGRDNQSGRLAGLLS